MNEIIRQKLTVLTSRPGVYIMKNSDNEVIYVGKAKNLKNCVSQYFVSNSSHTVKVIRMVSNVADFEYIVTSSELEALILENNLINISKSNYIEIDSNAMNTIYKLVMFHVERCKPTSEDCSTWNVLIYCVELFHVEQFVDKM